VHVARDNKSQLLGTWVAHNVDLAVDAEAGWSVVHVITTYSGDLQGTGHAGATRLRSDDGDLHAYANEIVTVTGALNGSFMDFGPIEVRSGQRNDMVADLYPSMGTGDFAGVRGKFSLTIREAGEDSYAGEWTLDIG
jgi:Protein of unknown function (DUF3224)